MHASNFAAFSSYSNGFHLFNFYDNVWRIFKINLCQFELKIKIINDRYHKPKAYLDFIHHFDDISKYIDQVLEPTRLHFNVTKC